MKTMMLGLTLLLSINSFAGRYKEDAKKVAAMTNAQLACTTEGQKIMADTLSKLITNDVEFRSKLYSELNNIGANINVEKRISNSVNNWFEIFSVATDCAGSREVLEEAGFSSVEIEDILAIGEEYIEDIYSQKQ
ncbi:MAG: hypothetical protein VX341_00865 [Bdellovibrionota bacterium]|nr:hypothetical protein [Bdellovibrionota bacterium]